LECLSRCCCRKIKDEESRANRELRVGQDIDARAIPNSSLPRIILANSMAQPVGFVYLSYKELKCRAKVNLIERLTGLKGHEAIFAYGKAAEKEAGMQLLLKEVGFDHCTCCDAYGHTSRDCMLAQEMDAIAAYDVWMELCGGPISTPICSTKPTGSSAARTDSPKTKGCTAPPPSRAASPNLVALMESAEKLWADEDDEC
jgi:hypothetical protein